MGLSIRSREVVKQRAAERRAEREAAARDADTVRRTMLRRCDAARYLGVSVSLLRELWAQSRGPRAVKLGVARQSRILYEVEELDRWRRDPLRYDTPARDATLGPFEPPRRGARPS